MRTFPLSFIQMAIEDEENVRPDGYGGRAMYGKTCAAITFDSLGDGFLFFATLGQIVGRDVETDEDSDADRQLDLLMRAVTTDSMGRGIVAYFPGWVFA